MTSLYNDNYIEIMQYILVMLYKVINLSQES